MTLKTFELNDVTLDMLKDRQIVIVDFDKNGGRCLTFLVSDTEYPQVPGYPALSLSYFDKVAEARKAINKKYDELKYWPKHKGHKSVFTSRRK